MCAVEHRGTSKAKMTTRRKLWGHPRSINVQKVLWALDELDLPFERIDVGGNFGRVRDADYLALNPNGLIPVLEDGDAVLWESNAIVRYLYAKYAAAPALPEDLAVRARADGWNDWFSSTFWPPIRVQLVQLIRTAEGQRDAQAIGTAREATLAALAVLERELSKTPYVAGKDFTFGDLPLAAAAQRWFNLAIERPSFPHVEAWYARIRERRGFKRYVDLPLT